MLKRACNGAVIGLMKTRQAVLKFFCVPVRIDEPVRRHDRTIRQLHDKGRIVLAPIQIDEETRIAPEQRRSFHHLRKAPRHFRRADVIGDVAGKFFFRKPQRAISFRQGVGGVIAEQKQPGTGRALDDFHRTINHTIAARCQRGGFQDRRSRGFGQHGRKMIWLLISSDAADDLL